MKRFALTVLVAMGILVPVTLVPAQGDGPEAPGPGFKPDLQVADTVVIQIVADADSVVAVPNSVTVARGQVVTWNCELGDWTVFFRSDQPFGQAAVGNGIRGGRGQANGRAVRGEAADGTYKYDILVRIQGEPNRRADPEVIIEPEQRQ